MHSHFFAYLNRMKYIRRWGLMRATQPENDMEHALQVALLAHGMALMARRDFGRDVNPEHVLALAVYHDAPEVMTGDLPTPVKYSSPSCARPTSAWSRKPGSGCSPWPPRPCGKITAPT